MRFLFCFWWNQNKDFPVAGNSVMCNNLVIVKSYLVLIPNPTPDVFKDCSLASLLRRRTIMPGFQLPCFGTSSWLLENVERDLRAVMLPKAATVAKEGFAGGLKPRLWTQPPVGPGQLLGPLCLTQGQGGSLPEHPTEAWWDLARLQPAVCHIQPLSHRSGWKGLGLPAKPF